MGGWVCVHSRTLWVSPMYSPVSLGVSPMPQPLEVFTARGLRLYSPVLDLWVVWSISLSSCSSQFILTQMQDCLVCQLLPHLPHPPPCHVSSLPWPPVSASPISLDECFFFNSLVVRLLYSSIFCHFWLFLFFNLLLSFFWLCEETQCVYLCLHLGQKCYM